MPCGTRIPRIAGVVVGLVVWASPLRAHKGPPFPLLMNVRVGPYTVQVWTDPDIGTGTFYIILDVPEGAAFPSPSAVRVGVRPVSGRLAEAVYDGASERVRQGARYAVKVQFDRGEMWDVRVIIAGPRGGGELTAQVEATPDGMIGPIGLVIYTIPFVLVGGLWIKAVMAKRRLRQDAQAAG